MGNSPLGTVGALQDTLITPGLSTGIACTVLRLGWGDPTDSKCYNTWNIGLEVLGYWLTALRRQGATHTDCSQTRSVQLVTFLTPFDYVHAYKFTLPMLVL